MGIENNACLLRKPVKGAFGSSLFCQNSEYPRISYFGHKKRSFDRLNVFYDNNKKSLVLVG